MAYVFQTFVLNQIHTAAQMNQTELNARDHEHGVAGVKSLQTTEDAVAILHAAASAPPVENTVTETDVVSKSIVGGTLGTDRGLRLTVAGRIKNNLDDGGRTITVRWKYGATTIFSHTVTVQPFNATSRTWRLLCELWADGATNAQVAFTHHFIGTAVGDNVPENIDGGIARAYSRHHSLTVDSTVNQDMKVTLQWSAANVNLSAIMEQARLEVLN